MSTKSIAALTRAWLALVAAASIVMLPSIATGATSSASSDFAAFATGIGCGAITISGNSYVDSFDSSKGTYSQTKQNSGGVIGANGNVNLSGQTVVYGSLAALNTAVGTCQNGTPGISLSGGAIVTGGYIRLSARLSFSNPSPVVPGTKDYILSADASLSPGSYRNISMSGGHTLTLAPGIYNINSIVLSGQSRLTISPMGQVIINVAGTNISQPIQLNGGTIYNPSGIPLNFQLVYGGSLPTVLSGGSMSYAFLYAPNSAVTLSGGGDWFGALVVNTLIDSGGSPLHFDRHLAIPPTITAALSPLPNAAGWNNANVTVSFACSDPILGIASCTSPITVTTEGKNQTVTGTAVNKAGINAILSVSVNLDKTPPTITTSQFPGPNANGWNNSNVTVSFTCGDSLSGVASCPSAVTVSADGANQIITRVATDVAGNTATASTTVSLDKTPPTITPSITPTPNSAGWNNTNVTVSFTCADATSGVASCPPPKTVTTEGTNQVIPGTATDNAGNQASASATINLDKTPPTLNITAPANGTAVNLPSVTVTGTATDSLSGLHSVTCAGTPATVSGSSFSCLVPIVQGPNSISVQATDIAGNTAQTTVSVQGGIPVLVSVSPNMGQQGQTNLSVSIGGQFTHFVQGTTTASFGAGITLASISVSSATSATAVLNIDPAATLGTRTISVTTGTEVASAAAGFAVIVGANNAPIVSAGADQTIVLTSDLFVVGESTNKVLRFNGATGSFIDTFIPSASGGLSFPVDIAIGPDGNFYVTTQQNLFTVDGGILRYSGVTGSFLGSFVATGSAGLENPTEIMFGPDGKLYVSDYGAHNVKRYDGSSGAFLDVFTSGGNPNLPQGIAFGPDGNFYLSDEQQVLRYNGTTGAFMDVFVPNGSGGLVLPLQILFGQDGKLYVCDSYGQQVLRYSGTTGAFLDAFVPPRSNGLSLPTGIAFGPDGDFYIGDQANGQIQRYDPRTGAFLGVFVPAGTGGLTGPTEAIANISFQNAGSGMLNGIFADDGFPTGAALTATWEKVSGPGPVTFSNQSLSAPDLPGQVNPAKTQVGFTVPGTYVLRLSVSDSQLTSSSDVTITVNPAAPVLTSVAPNSGQQGQQNLSVAITGRFTHFAQGTSQVSFGTGITVGTVTVSSATSLTAQITIAANAAVGALNVSVTTGTEVVSMPGGFTVTQPGNQPPVVTVGPNQTITFPLSQFTFFEYPGPSAPTFESNYTMVDITSGPDGNLWFTENYANGAQTQVGRMTPAGVLTLFSVPSGSSEGAITTGPDGNLWFTEYRTGKIGRSDTAGNITEFSIPSGSVFPSGITSGADGNLWFTETLAPRVGRISPSGIITEFPITGGSSWQITTGPDGNIWFTDRTANQIGRITPTGTVTEFLIPTPGSNTTGIGVGSDGNLWFAEVTANKIGRITTAGVITEFTLPSAVGSPAYITKGPAPDGNLWFSNRSGNQIGRITPAGIITLFPIPTASDMGGITTGPDGNLWFLESTANKVVKTVFGGFINQATANLIGSITDDGLPLGAALSTTWSTSSAPAPVSFSNPTATFPDVTGQVNPVTTSATFSAPGTYVLSLAGTDSQLSAGSSVTVTVNPPPAILVVSPNIGLQGEQNLRVNITGQFTNWAQGTTTASFGAGITVALLTVNSPTNATAVVYIDPAAAFGPRDVTLTTNAEADTLTNGFTVSPSALVPAITKISPNLGLHGQQSISVGIIGQFTHFAAGTTTANFGSGITVTSLTVNSATSATAVLNIDSAAATGPRDVTLTTGTESLTLSGGFTVTTGTPALSGGRIVAGHDVNTLSSSVAGPNEDQFAVNLALWLTGKTNGTILAVESSPGDGTRDYASSVKTALTSAGFTVNYVSDPTAISALTTSDLQPYDAVFTGITFPTEASINSSALTQYVNGGGNVYVYGGVDTIPAGEAAFLNPFLQVFGLAFDTASYNGLTLVNITSQHPIFNGLTGKTLGAGNGQDIHDLATNSNASIVQFQGVHGVYAVATILPGTPILTSLVPASGQQGQTLSVSITGQFTHFTQGTTQVSLGSGITVANVNVSSATSLTAQVTISSASAPGTTTLTVTTGTEVVSVPNVFHVLAATPFVTQLNPGSGQQGQQNLSVSITGQNTHFAQGTSQVTFGAGITVASVTVSSPTAATAVISIDPAAALGTRTVTVTTNAEVASFSNGFTVLAGSPALLSVTPNTGQQGQKSLSVSVSGQFTQFVQGSTLASFGTGITVTSLTVTSATSATVVLSVDPAATLGARNVTLTTGTEVANLLNGFAVTTGTPAVLSVNPTGGQQGAQNLQVTITGQFTHFAQGTTTASFGTGITVSSLTVNSPTSAMAVLTIDPAAPLGARNVTLTTNTETVTLISGFAVTQSSALPVITTISPNSGQQGQQNLSVAITGQSTHFLQGTTTASFGAGITVVSLTVSSATTATALVSISPTAASGTQTVTLTTGTEAASLSNGFTVAAGTPVLTLLSPNSGQQGQQNLLVGITGQFTHFASGTTAANFGSGITVALLAVNSSTSASAVLDIDPAAALGARNVTLSTGSEIVTVSSGFTILQSSSGPAIISLSPNSALPGQAIHVTVTGQNTHFLQGTTQVNFGPQISVGAGPAGAYGPVQVTSPTTAIAQVNVPNNAVLGPRTVVAQTGSELANIVNGFAVTGTPYISSLSPNHSQTGQTITVAITGVFTHFHQGATQASFGAGVSVGGAAQGTPGPVTVTSPSTATAQLTIDPLATPGLRSPVTLITGAEQASFTNSGFLVFGPVTGPGPVVSITSPTEGSEVTAPTTVAGTVTSPNLSNWILEYEASGSTIFTQFAAGTTSAVSGTLDPTLLLNGIAQIRLTGVDQSGQTTSTIVDVVITRNQKVGNFTLSFNDLTIPVAGIPIQIIRTYDSRNKSSGDFGFGWSLDIQTTKLDVNGILGGNWTGITSGGAFPTYCVQPTQNYVVSVRVPGGTVYQFAPTLNGGCQQLVPPSTVDVTFIPIGATPQNASLTAVNSTGLFVSGSFPGQVQLVDQTTVQPFDPDQLILTLPTGQQLQISRTFGVQSITDTNGNTLTISATGVTSSAGKSVGFVRDAQNRITTITDPSGNVLTYAYDANGDLATFTDQLMNVSTFAYDGAHNLLSFKDPRGTQPIRNVYDDSGRLIQQIDAFGHVINFTHDIGASTETVSDFLGNLTTYVYDANGNIISATDPLGNVTTATFDSRDNKLTETNALSKTRSYTYDANNNRLTETDPLSNTTTYAYNSRNQVLAITDALGRSTTNAYDPNGNLLSTKDAAGNTTTYVYNGQGLRTSMTDPLSGVTTYQYDAVGNLTQQTDALGKVTSYTYDGNGNKLSETKTRTTASGQQTLLTSYQYDGQNRLTQTTYPDGSTTQIQYNALGKQSVTIDQLGRQTSYRYDLMGRLVQTTFPDGTTEITTYDAEGNRIATTDRGGRTTTFTYDPLKRLTSTTYADGATTSTTYDGIGEVTAVTDPRGNATQYQYDAAGRRTKVIDAMTHATSFIYDSVGNQLSMTDANANATQYQYDALNRRTKTIYPDTTFDSVAYDALGRTISKTDQASLTTQFLYDKLGRLIQVTDALGQLTKYTYDEGGNRISQTDANTHTTSFAYDKLGRRTSRMLPLGMLESMNYDSVGNLISKTDFNGKTTAYSYDLSNRLATKTPDASFGAPVISLTYTATGQRQSMTDASGTTTYSYDLRDRLTQKITPFGTLTYSYDATGNLTSIRSSNATGTSVNYIYDALNRLSSVVDNRLAAGTTTYAYGNVGNLQSYAYPNGVQTAYSYNALNRLTNVTISKGAALATYGYQSGPAGNRTQVSELGGRTVNYTYDNLYRLTGETIAGATINGSIGYQYDPVGNRLQRTSTVSPIPLATYSYDANDRLASDTYDADGNTIASAGNTYSYDFENHLTSQSSSNGAVTIVYDGDGNRISKTVGGVTTNYLVDDRNLTGYSQVFEELLGGTVQRVYTYGLSRISQSQASGTSFYGYDGHGNVRILTDTTGAITDRYDYDAFGETIASAGSTTNAYLYTGENFDKELTLYYLRARYLNQASGRFFSMDSVEGDFTNPRSLAKYSYVSNDPLDERDPSGNLGLPDIVAFNLNADFALINPPLLQAGVNSVLASFITPRGSPLSSPWTITSDFTPLRLLNGTLGPHRGVDLQKVDANGNGSSALTFGQPVLATADGQVEFAGWCGDFGNLVKIAHTLKPIPVGSGCQGSSGPFLYETLYGHNLFFNVSPWSFVHKGDTIAFADSTGRSTGSHVHYEIRQFGVPIDPVPFLF